MKNKLFEKAIAWTKKRGFKKIKANVEDEEFESPRSLTFVSKDKVVTPDITAMHMDRKAYIEIALKDEENKQSIISKWKLFCTLAARKGGNLYLLAARGHKTFAQNIVKEYNLKNVKVVSI